jgi:glycogen operon protein
MHQAEVTLNNFDLGVNLVPGGVNVALFAENATAVDFCVVNPDGSETRWRLPEKERGIWHGFVPDIQAGTKYGFRVDGPWDPAHGHRHNPNKFLIDPYAKAIDGDWQLTPAAFGYVFNPQSPTDESKLNTLDSAASMPKCIVVEDNFDWMGVERPSRPFHELVIYEAHVKGMTIKHPDVPEELRGTYAGLAHESIIAHLKSIGANAIELLPIHQIGHEEHLVRQGKTNYWGYNTMGYFAPHHAYAASGSDGQQVNEFKNMVKDFHAAGIEVILDVVYNHTSEGGPRGPVMSFKGIDNASYYRLPSDPSHYFDTTGCSNTLNTSNPHVMQLVLDSLRYWVTEMQVDGFRFDLAPALARNGAHNVEMFGPLMQAISQDPILRAVRLIAEPWDIGAGGYHLGEYPRAWSEWNDKFRDVVRDFWRGRSNGVSALATRLAGSSDIFAKRDRRPRASINFVTAHDGFTLRDLVSYNEKHNDANGEGNRDGNDTNRSWNHGIEGETTDSAINALRLQQQRNLMAMLLLSGGIPMITAGDEHGRTQSGNNNAYCQDSSISWIDWQIEGDRADILQTTKNLMQLRKSNPVFDPKLYRFGGPTTSGGPKDLAWFTNLGTEFTDKDWAFSDCHTIGMFLNKSSLNGDADSANSFLLVFHSSGDVVEFTVPSAEWGKTWELVFDSTRPAGEPIPQEVMAGEKLVLPSRSALVFRTVED